MLLREGFKRYFDFTVNQHPVITIWDGGVNNTLDLSGWSTPSIINLNPGTFSSANGMFNNIAIVGSSDPLPKLATPDGTPVYIYSRATANGKRAQCFGGAKNHAIIMPDADMDQTVDALIGAGYGSAGERCMAISVAVLVGDVADKVMPQLIERTRALKIKNGMELDAEMGPIVTAAARDRIEGYVAQGVAEDADRAAVGNQQRRQQAGAPLPFLERRMVERPCERRIILQLLRRRDHDGRDDRPGRCGCRPAERGADRVVHDRSRQAGGSDHRRPQVYEAQRPRERDHVAAVDEALAEPRAGRRVVSGLVRGRRLEEAVEFCTARTH